MIHVIKHDIDHNMDLNYRRKIRPQDTLDMSMKFQSNNFTMIMVDRGSFFQIKA